MDYCEQFAAHGAFEPFNALTNLAFLLAAAWGRHALRRATRRLPLAPRTLPLLAGAIGAGSFAWHATGAAWAELADVLPIALFVLVFLGSALRGLVGLDVGATLAACTALLAACVVAGVLGGGRLNGSVAYLPVLAGLCALAAACARRDAALARGLLGGSALFALSLALRTADLATCEWTGIGTHWLWHLLNGLLLARLMSLLARHHGRGGAPARRPAPE